MKIDVNDPTQLISHLFLQKDTIVNQVVETEQFRKDGTIEATVYFNGVKMPAETLEEVLRHFVSCIEKEVDMEGFNDKVQAKAEEILRTHTDNILEKFRVLEEINDRPEDFIKSGWEI